jgi:AraC family transcriptional regulator
MSPRERDPRIAWITDYMQRHMAEALSVAMLAERLNLSGSRFTALFRAQTGVAPMRYVRRARLRRARLLLERTFLTIGNIMTIVGYGDLSRFECDFRREHGVPPGALRSAELTTPLRAAAPDEPLEKRRSRTSRARDPAYH